MTALREVAFLLRKTEATPKTFGVSPVYSAIRSFHCTWRSLSAQENVRAGRDAGNEGLRIFFYTSEITPRLADKVRIDDKQYDVVSNPVLAPASRIAYFDTKAEQ